MSRVQVYHPTPEDVAEAFRRSQEMGVLPNSLTRGGGRMVGFLGEVAFENVFGGKYVGNKSYTHDFEFGNTTVDVKAKVCSSPPLPHYSASVFASRKKDLAADIYFFTRVRKDWARVWFVGWTTASALQKKKHFRKKGEADETGFTFMGDGYHLPIKKTRRPDSFLSVL